MITAAEIRTSMRITHTSLDADIQRNMDAARLELSRVGIDDSVDDKLTDKALELYVKANFDYQGKGDQFMKNFEKLRDSLSLSSGYKED